MSDIANIGKQVESRIQAETVAYPTSAKKDECLSVRFVQQCLNANELGDGLLCAEFLRHRFINNVSTKYWLKWCGHSWAEDVEDSHLAAVEDVVDALLSVCALIEQEIRGATTAGDEGKRNQLETLRSRIYKRINSRFRTDKGRNAAMKFARTCRNPLAITGEKLDLNPWLFACANGVIDLRIGELRDGRPEQFISKASPVRWKGLDEPALIWERTLLEILCDAQELVGFLRRWFGYCLTGMTNEHKFLLMAGLTARHGNGTILETVGEVMGPLSGPIQAEMLLDQRYARNSAAPSPDIMRLQGLRLVWASESDEGQHFSSSRIKWITGGDSLVGRSPHDKHHLQFRPSHKLALLTNSKPGAPATDNGFWERLLLVSFNLSFVDRDPIAPYERRANKNLRGQLRAEHSGILAWLVRGCLEYQDQGLNPPRCITEATVKYRRDEDVLAGFLSDCCTVQHGLEINFVDFFDAASKWWEENVSRQKKLTKTGLGRLLRGRFEKDDTRRPVVYLGVGLKT